jgi:hypothetical protein
VWHDGRMQITDPATAARRELDRLTAAFTAAEAKVEEQRKPLHEAILRHLKARNAPPGRIADHTPYDRVWVNALAREAGVPPVKGRNAVGPPPVYDEETVTAALAELDKVTAAFIRAEGKVEEKRRPLHEAIARHYAERNLAPGEMAKHTPYDRNHIGRIVKAAGVPTIRQRRS